MNKAHGFLITDYTERNKEEYIMYQKNTQLKIAKIMRFYEPNNSTDQRAECDFSYSILFALKLTESLECLKSRFSALRMVFDLTYYCVLCFQNITGLIN